MQVEIGRARHQPVCQIHVRSPWSQSPQCLSSSGTTQAHTLLRVPDGSSLAAGKNTISPSFFLSRAECVSSALQTCFSLFSFIFIHNMLVQTLSFAKAYQRPPRPPPRKKTGGASSPFSGGRIAGAGFWSPRAGAGSDGKRRQGLTRCFPNAVFPKSIISELWLLNYIEQQWKNCDRSWFGKQALSILTLSFFCADRFSIERIIK